MIKKLCTTSGALSLLLLSHLLLLLHCLLYKTLEYSQLMGFSRKDVRQSYYWIHMHTIILCGSTLHHYQYHLGPPFT